MSPQEFSDLFDGFVWNDRVAAWVRIDVMGDDPARPGQSRLKVGRTMMADVVVAGTEPAVVEEALSDIAGMMTSMVVGPDTQHVEVSCSDPDRFRLEMVRVARMVWAGVSVVVHPTPPPPGP